MTTDYTPLVVIWVLAVPALALIFWFTRKGGPFDQPPKPPRWPWLRTAVAAVVMAVTAGACVVGFAVSGREVTTALAKGNSLAAVVLAVPLGALGTWVFTSWAPPEALSHGIKRAIFVGSFMIFAASFDAVDVFFGHAARSAAAFGCLAYLIGLCIVLLWRYVSASVANKGIGPTP